MGLASVVAVGESSILQKLTLGLSEERMRFLRISVQQDSKRMYARRETTCTRSHGRPFVEVRAASICLRAHVDPALIGITLLSPMEKLLLRRIVE